MSYIGIFPAISLFLFLLTYKFLVYTSIRTVSMVLC